METSIEITVDTIGHYTRNNNMNLIEAPPPRLNMKPFTREVYPNYSLTTHEYRDSGKVEDFMESLLDFIRTRRLVVKDKIITTRQGLAAVACGSLERAIIIFRMNGTFLLPVKMKRTYEETTNYDPADDYQRAGNFQHFLTRTTEEQPIKTDRNSYKAVMMTSIVAKEKGNAANDKHSLLYAAEIDALGENDYDHYEFKVVRGGIKNNWFWSNKSERDYWQAVLGNVEKIICGTRSDIDKSGEAAFMLSSLQILNREDIPGEFEKKKEEYLKKPKQTNAAEPFSGPSWSVEIGKRNLHELFKLVKRQCINKRLCYVATSKESDGLVKWVISPVHQNHEDNKQVDHFLKVLEEKLPEEPKKDAKSVRINSEKPVRAAPWEPVQKPGAAKTDKKKLAKEAGEKETGGNEGAKKRAKEGTDEKEPIKNKKSKETNKNNVSQAGPLHNRFSCLPEE